MSTRSKNKQSGDHPSQNTAPITRIFLSHASLDQALAERVKQLLMDVSLGFLETWLSCSIDGLQPGDNLWDEVHERLRNADQIITLLTPNSYGRSWLLYESGYVAGSQRGAHVIPLLFGIEKAQLPQPLSAYVMYSGDKAEDMTRLLLQLLAGVSSHVKPELVKAQVVLFLSELESVLNIQPPLMESQTEQEMLETMGIRFVDKLKASEILHRRLADPAVKRITIVTYTNEVEAGVMTNYRVLGNKEIEVFKRSIISDLSEQQTCNLTRLAAGSLLKPWDKKAISLKASQQVDREFADSNQVLIKQFFYDHPPTKRAYIFDGKEAIVGYYEHIEDPLSRGGSLYKGMGDPLRLWVSNKSQVGRFLLEEMLLHVHSLRLSSHSWTEERAALEENAPLDKHRRPPCLDPRAVFLDMDGVLYDSLPQYVEAWSLAFQEVSIDLPTIEVYRQEGRMGRETVRTVMQRLGLRNVSDAKIDVVLKKKAEVLASFDPPPIQKGARDLIGAIADSKLPIWVVTGSTREGVPERLARDFDGMIAAEAVITGSRVQNGKPDPEPYRLATEEARIRPDQAIVIENAPLGIESATVCGTFCIAVNTGILKDEELRDSGARVVFSGCTSLATSWASVLKTLRM